jgi:inner membrane protein
MEPGSKMSDHPTVGSNLSATINSRSLGVKLIVVCGLALLMMIPAFFVQGVVEDRSNRAGEVTGEISSHVGGPQTFLGPTLAIPYSIPAATHAELPARGVYLVFPAYASAVLKTTTEERRRSLFKVPVYQADLKLDASFDLAGVPAAAPPQAELDWSRAEIAIGVSGARGALADATVSANGKVSTLVPAQVADGASFGNDQAQHLKMTFFGARAEGIAKPEGQFNVSAALQFSGAQRIAVLAYGKTTHVTVQGDWPSPGFDGGFLPVTRAVSGHGFSAEWSVPFIARGVRAEGRAETITGLDGTALGVSFIEVADPYQSVNRSIKYVPLFLGLIFLSYFVFEVTTCKRLHPAQYILVGIAQIIFYLLLLSIAERIGFDFGFLIAGASTVVLLAANTGWIFSSRIQAIRALIVFSLLYSLIYLLLRLEDNALLVGAISSFLAVAAVMYLTREIDWYSSLAELRAREPGDGRVTPQNTV